MHLPRHLSNLTLLLAGLLIAWLFETEILHFILSLRTPSLTHPLLWISYAGSFLIVLFVTTVLFVLVRRERKRTPLLWLILGSAAFFTWILKILIARARPPVEALVAFSNYSFPSGHATAVFSVLPLLIKDFPRLKRYWIGFSLLVLFSRVYLGAHYLSDVIAGAFIGYSIGVSILWAEGKTKLLEKIYLKLQKLVR